MTKIPGGEIGKRLLPVIIDDVARDNPDRAWASLPVDDYDLQQGFEDISFARFANAINKLAHCIVSEFGRSHTFDTIIYCGVPDIRYYMLLLAVAKSGHKVLYTSPLNSLDLHLSLMDQCDCQAMLFARGVYVEDILARRPMPAVEIPELDDLLDINDLAEPFPYTKTWDEAKRDPFAICQTSGTTGEPRPIQYTHASMACLDRQTELDDVDGRRHWTWQCEIGTRYMMAASPFHAIAAVLAMTVCGFGGGVLIPGFRHRPVKDFGDLCDIIKHSRVTAGFVPFMLMDIIARRPDADDLIKRFETITYGNGILSDYAGKLWLKHGVRFQNVWGSCETLAPPVLVADAEDYAYVYFDVDAGGVQFRERDDLEHFDDDGSRLPLYEMVMTLTQKSARCVGYWTQFGITEAPSGPPWPEYATGEVWTPHPDPKKEKYAWRFVSRLFDLITHAREFSIVFEKSLGHNKKVQNTIILGKPGEQPVALIELAEGVRPETADDVWETSIVPENEALPEKARITSSHVILIEYGGFVRGTEGHMMRTQTEKKYASRIDQVYGRGLHKVVVDRPRYESIIETVEVVEVVEVVELLDSALSVHVH